MRYGNLIIAVSLVATLCCQQLAAIDSLTVAECVRLAMRNNRRLHAAMMRSEQSEARGAEAFSALLPTLKATTGYTRLSDVPDFSITIPSYPRPQTMTLSEAIPNSYQVKVTLQQPLFVGNRLTSQHALQQQAASAARQDLRAEQRDLALTVTNAYWALYQAREVERVVEDNVRQVESHLRDMENMVAQGMATVNDRLKVRLQLSNAKLMRIDAANAARVAEIGLNNACGRPLDSPAILASGPDTAGSDDRNLGALQQQAAAARPELKALRARAQAGRSGVSMARAGWYPQLFGVANYAYARPNQRIFPAKDRFDGTWDAGVLLSLDIWNWGATRHQVRQARAQLAQAEDALALAADGVSVEVNVAWLDCQRCREKIAVTADGVAQAQENFRTTDERFRNGLATNSDLLDAENSLLQARLSHTRALVERQVAQARLAKAVGE